MFMWNVQRVTGVSGIALIVAIVGHLGCLEPGSDDESERKMKGGDATTEGPRDASRTDTDSSNDGPNRRDTRTRTDGTGSAGGDARSIDGSEDTSATSDTGTETVRATLQFQKALGGGLTDASVSYDEMTKTTDSNGTVDFSIPSNSLFTVRMNKENYAEHRLVGRAGSSDFRYVSFTASRATSQQAFGSAGVTLDSNRGILVVGVDEIVSRAPFLQLEPMIGASVNLDSDHGQAITIGGGFPDADATIEEGEQGFVAFPNVATGPVDISVQPPEDKSCELYPGGGDQPDITIDADTVTVVTFVCQ